ncbi:MAG: hypothetical protein WDM84_08985 [Bauldia sp.]
MRRQHGVLQLPADHRRAAQHQRDDRTSTYWTGTNTSSSSGTTGGYLNINASAAGGVDNVTLNVLSTSTTSPTLVNAKTDAIGIQLISSKSGDVNVQEIDGVVPSSDTTLGNLGVTIKVLQRRSAPAERLGLDRTTRPPPAASSSRPTASSRLQVSASRPPTTTLARASTAKGGAKGVHITVAGGSITSDYSQGISAEAGNNGSVEVTVDQGRQGCRRRHRKYQRWQGRLGLHHHCQQRQRVGHERRLDLRRRHPGDDGHGRGWSDRPRRPALAPSPSRTTKAVSYRPPVLRERERPRRSGHCRERRRRQHQGLHAAFSGTGGGTSDITLTNYGHIQGTNGAGSVLSGADDITVNNQSLGSMIGTTNGQEIYGSNTATYDNGSGLTAGFGTASTLNSGLYIHDIAGCYGHAAAVRRHGQQYGGSARHIGRHHRRRGKRRLGVPPVFPRRPTHPA